MLKFLLRLMSKRLRFGLFHQILVPREYQALPSEQPIQDNQLTSDYSTGEYQLNTQCGQYVLTPTKKNTALVGVNTYHRRYQGCISCGPCSCPELTEDHVLPSAYVEIFRTVTRNAVNKSV